MARGPYRLALTRAKVQTPLGEFTNAYLYVRDDVATIKVGSEIVAESPVLETTRISRRSGTITTPDGVWEFTRDCGCGGR